MTPQGRHYQKEYASELLRIAQGDLGSAKDLFQGSQGRLENTCYLAQQAVEKSLKAAMVHLGLAVIHTHDLETLINLLPVFQRPPQCDQIIALTAYATIRRYEEGYEILTKTDLNQVIQLAESVVSWTKNLICSK